VKVADVAPCGTVTLDGTEASVELELESPTKTPPVPAADVRVTVPMPDCLLTMVLGLTETLLRAAGTGAMVTPNVAFTPE
jgi:hypothetical protein